MKSELENIDKDIIQIYKPEIDKFRKLIQGFLVDQKTENFSLLKEIKLLETDKIELQNQIYKEVIRLNRFESMVGIEKTVFDKKLDETIFNSAINQLNK